MRQRWTIKGAHICQRHFSSSAFEVVVACSFSLLPGSAHLFKRTIVSVCVCVCAFLCSFYLRTICSMTSRERPHGGCLDINFYLDLPSRSLEKMRKIFPKRLFSKAKNKKSPEKQTQVYPAQVFISNHCWRRGSLRSSCPPL